ncbi:DUF2330 domain-containing protein [Luteipulveratus halotolerans]|uniref:DUF2330 domain-containing protein n=1 Tax=Luteipulveratus halotolerans TaxID=1631356 RepID=A0A0L6CM59_9MICO|nr:DUF2330 domain-containing protein [Luteipulveratus halotolerans]KNX38720.1 hypothetical protein VV01_18760 [Luteipulveratus halotolerans]
MRVRRRAAQLVAVVLMALGLIAVGPASSYACACGAMIPSDSGARSSGELGLVQWDGRTETLDLSMVINGRTRDAAWIMPAPKDTRVTLGEKALFDRLKEATKPRVEKRYHYGPDFSFGGDGDGAGAGSDAGGAPGAAVSVEGTSTVGPFQVTTLSGTDGSAVNSWLTSHGYPARPDLVPSLQSYLDQGWRLYAVKLTPTAGQLQGELSPLRMTFPAAKPVYPIRLSEHAKDFQSVVVYVAAAHRMDQDLPTAPRDEAPGVAFARWVDPTLLDPTRSYPSGQRVFLTKTMTHAAPGQIDADFTYSRAAADTEYQEVEYVDVDRSWVSELAIAVVGLLVLLGGVGWAVRRGRGRLRTHS